MSNLEALLLGVVQGLTEFLPISSSGYLILVPVAAELTFLQDHEAFNKTFDVDSTATPPPASPSCC